MATARRAGATRLTADAWTAVALEAIAEGGLAAVSVEGLARRLGATKGSFYWHFDNRDALIKATLGAWEAGETIAVAKMLAPLPDAASRLRVLLRAALDDRAGARVEAGLLADSNVPVVRASLERATRARTGYLRQLFERIGVDDSQDRATTAFALYLGLLHMRRAGASTTPRGKELDRYVTQVCDWLIHGTGGPSTTAER
jgi:AcrR family transcriptional regulator